MEGCVSGMRLMKQKSPNQSIQRMGARRLAHFHFRSLGRLAPTADAHRLDKDQFSFLRKTCDGGASMKTKGTFGRRNDQVALLRLRSTLGALDPTAAQRDGG